MMLCTESSHGSPPASQFPTLDGEGQGTGQLAVIYNKEHRVTMKEL